MLTIFAWILTFAMMGFYMFRFSFEGTQQFSSISQSYSSMLTLITTANFPDVMLPAYHKNYWMMLFFICYLLIGLFFLMNLLLANVFQKFKERYQMRISKEKDKRRNNVELIYDMFEPEGRGYLNQEEF